MQLLNTYHAANQILNTLDYPALFAGFHKYKFALYNSEWVCLDGKLIPYETCFMGNTSITYKGELVAIWNIEADPTQDMEHLAYCLVHEMFHCHQKEHHEARYPSDLALLSYPDDLDHFLKKHHENRFLAEAYEEQDIETFKKFHALRSTRFHQYPDMVSQELRAETLEGLAEYVGLMALQRINADKFLSIVNSYVKKLKTADQLLFDIRRISYYCGAIYFLCLDRFGVAEKCTFGSKQTAYEQNAAHFSGNIPIEITPCPDISCHHSELLKTKKAVITDHISKSTFIPCHATICGYDPMNMFRMDDILYCSHFICLNIDGNTKMLQCAVALKMKDHTNNEITGYYIPTVNA